MAIVGLKLVKLALVDPKTQKLIKGPEGLSTDGVIEIDSKMLGTRTANISNLEGQATKVPGNNEVQDIMIAPGSPTVAFEFNNLDFDIKQKILGFKSDKKGGYVYQGEKPHVAVLIESQTLDRKNSVYFGFANGIFQESTQNVATDTDTAQTRQNDHLTYNALSATEFGGEPIKKYFTGSSTFDKANMYKEVFGGYTLATSTAV
ncbi:major tail protein [Streptococcus phage SW3]|uniref:Major tail protein n=3 Tax=Moineauvirus TaxID=1623304 RepID=A0A3G8FBE6_9CAUD|nr:major tail protein [Streptococcus phage 128]YP_010645614.1 major tail protein [Streptococcus phage CHPC1156]YP_010647932.1 major tail protein [Streptococcus phage SW3]ATI17151.1 major tail protein [Streptococcus phage 7T]ATI19644.1 major tail protein [Streptococcus phage 16B8]AVO22661.1 major tail protein [Streptococcus phage D5842]AXF53719.1 major tail protein [Streptococcus phage 142]AYP29381.1 major tail protein [Streptococcus phage SW10]TKW62531.1 MAG: phage tail protein [Streptococc